MNDKVSFVPGIYYSQKGFKMEESYNEDEYVAKTKTTAKLNYIDVPLLVKVVLMLLTALNCMAFLVPI